VACRREIVIRAGADIRVFLSAACSLAPAVALKNSSLCALAYTSARWSFGSCQRLKAAADIRNCHLIFQKTAQFGLMHSDRVIQPNAFSISGRFLWQFGTHGRHLAASTWQADHVVAIVVRNCDKTIFNHV